MKDAEIKERLRAFINSEFDGNVSKLARALDLKPAHLTVMLGAEEKGVSNIFYKKLPELGLNLNWLVTGKGEMFLGGEENTELLAHIEKLEFYIERMETQMQKLLKGGQ